MRTTATRFGTLLGMILFIAVPVISQKDDGTVKIRIQKNIDGDVTVEEYEYDLSEGMDLDEILEEQDIDINIDEMEGKKVVEIIVNGESERMEFDSDGNEFHFEGHGSCSMKSKPLLGVYHDSQYQGNGVRISEVIQGSAAADMGMKAGDVIIEFEGTAITDFTQLRETIAEHEVGEQVKVKYERDGSTVKVKGELGSKGDQVSSYHYSAPGNCHENVFFFDSDEFGEDMSDMMEELEERFEDFEFEFEGDYDREKLNEMIEELQEQFGNMDFDMDFDIQRDVRVMVLIEDISEEELSEVNAQADPKIKANNDLALDNVRFFPNPSSGQFNIEFTSPDQGDLNVIIYDAAGEKVYYEMLGSFEGTYANSIDISERPAGNYFIQVIQNDRTYSKKIIKE